MNDQTLRDQINKRFTLNWLIQGAAQHAGMTFHHLVRDELDALDPRLVRLYDQYALINLLQYWSVDGIVLLGWPPRFWRRAGSKTSNPFFGHPLLSKFGGMLALAGKQRAIERCKEKGVTRIPILFSFQATFLARIFHRRDWSWTWWGDGLTAPQGWCAVRMSNRSPRSAWR